jgi:predicted nuclease of predicted toxin-antitoxin system
VKLLLDENLSPRLVPRLQSLFPDLTHVRDIGLRQADDRTIWEWARTHDYAVVTTDADFVGMSQRLGWPPLIIHIEHCDHPLRIIEDLMRRSAVRIAAFGNDPTVGILPLRLPSHAV